MFLPVELVVSVILGISAFHGVESRPSSHLSIALKRCETTLANSTAMEQCSAVCLPVQTAQLTCHDSVACTCSVVSAEMLQQCLECHVSGSLNGRDSEATMLIPARIKAYSNLCDGSTDVIAPFPRNPTPESASPIERREVADDCLFGMPEILINQPPTAISTSFSSSLRSPWFILVFIIVFVGRVVQVRLRSGQEGKN